MRVDKRCDEIPGETDSCISKANPVIALIDPQVPSAKVEFDLTTVFDHTADVVEFLPRLAVLVTNQAELLRRVHAQLDILAAVNESVIDEDLFFGSLHRLVSGISRVDG